jgi:FtsH-binding integral membrane protein
MQTNSVFTRTSSSGKLLSPAVYNLMIGLTLLWGFLANFWIIGGIPVESLLPYFWPLQVGNFVCALIGIFIFNRSDNPAISFLGYNLVVLPFGLGLNLIINFFLSDPKFDGLVLEAVQTTGFVTLVMMMLGSMFPRFFQKISGALFWSFMAVILVEWIGWLVFQWHHGAIDWIVAIIICGYIGYDWGRANAIPKTLDNAIDSAAALYMDIIILFQRIMFIMARRR